MEPVQSQKGRGKPLDGVYPERPPGRAARPNDRQVGPARTLFGTGGQVRTRSREAQGKLVLIIGPSGVGKSVILKSLRESRPEWHFPRSATTRPRREREGDDLYRFVTDAEFDALVSDGKFLEWAVVHGGPPGPDGSVRAGARYGTLLSEIVPAIEEGKIVVREVDVQGFDSIRTHPLFRRRDACFGRLSTSLGVSQKGVHVARKTYSLQSIFILPESRDQLVSRIMRRAPIAQKELRRRIASIGNEMTYAKLCDASVRNVEGALERAVREVERVIGTP